MKANYVRMIKHRFPQIAPAEIAQEIALAELQAAGRGERLVWSIAEKNLLDLERKRMRYERMFPVELMDTDQTEGIECHLFEAFLDDMEWRDIMSGLPLPARKLAQFAKQEAEGFENVPDGIWRRQNLRELRRRVKRDYIAWDRSHSEAAYLAARNILVNAMHRRECRAKKSAYKCMRT